jgi:hypothetical protein
MNKRFRANSIGLIEGAASWQAESDLPKKGRTDMNLKTTGIALGVVAALAAGAAFAHPAPQPGSYDQSQGYYQQAPGPQAQYQHRHRHGIVALLKEEMSAGRLSHKEGSLLIQKIKELRAERREAREARYGGEGGPSQMQPPR